MAKAKRYDYSEMLSQGDKQEFRRQVKRLKNNIYKYNKKGDLETAQTISNVLDDLTRGEITQWNIENLSSFTPAEAKELNEVYGSEYFEDANKQYYIDEASLIIRTLLNIAYAAPDYLYFEYRRYRKGKSYTEHRKVLNDGKIRAIEILQNADVTNFPQNIINNRQQLIDLVEAIVSIYDEKELDVFFDALIEIINGDRSFGKNESIYDMPSYRELSEEE